MILSKKKTKVSVSGRVCLAGENIDWISGPVLTAALDSLRTSIEIFSIPNKKVLIQYNRLQNAFDQFELGKKYKYERESSDYIKAVLGALLKMGYKINNGINIKVNTSLPNSGGLASSGSFCVALVAAINAHYGFNMNNQQIAEMAYIAENEEMGIGCGQMDQYAVSLGGILYLNCSTRPPEIENLYSKENIFLVIGDSGKSMKFDDVGIKLRQRLEEKDPFLLKYVTETEKLIKQAKKMLVNKDWNPECFGALLNKCHDYIKNYKKILNPVIENYINAARNAGAYGAKSTGARSEGGCMFALCSSESSKKVAAAIINNGGNAFITKIAKQGILYE